jgi:hypothetical protein
MEDKHNNSRMEDEYNNSRIEDTHNNSPLEDEHYTVRVVRKTCIVSIWGNNDQVKIAIAPQNM